MAAAPGGWFVYTTTFDLTGLDAATAIISGRWASDNAAYIKLNGVATGTFNLDGNGNPDTVSGTGNIIPFQYNTNPGTPYSFEDWTNFSISASNYAFNSGINTLEFLVFNGYTNANSTNPPGPTGLRVEMTGTASIVDVPEPATASLVAIGLAGMAGYRLRRRNQNATA